jgi:putative ABC transport system permease protein
MFLIKLALKNLSRHKRRTLITAFVIAIAVLIYIIIDSLMIGIEVLSYDNIIKLRTGHVQIFNTEYWGKREELPLENLIEENQSIIEDINKIPEVEGMAFLLQFSGNLNNGIEELPVIGLGADPLELKTVFTIEDYLIDGSMFSMGENKAVLGQDLVKLMDLNMGDYITLLLRTKEGTFNTIDAEITGILNSPHPEVNGNIVFLPLDLVQDTLNVGNKASQIVLRLDNREKSSETTQVLSKGFTHKGLPLSAYSWEESAQEILAMSQSQKIENQVILAIILLIAAVGIINTIILSALERMEEIGMMKALGLREWEIIILFIIEAIGIGIIGGLIGSLLGLIGISIFNIFGLDLALLAEDGNTYGLPILGKIYGGWRLKSFVFVFSYSLIVAFFSSILPSCWIARKDPVKAINHR